MSKTHSSLADRAFVITSLILVIVGIGAAFKILGSPAQQRRVSLDQQRVQNLGDIARQLKMRAEETSAAESKLPAQLPEELNFVRDPVTDEPYDYQRLSESTYELCATFATDSSEYARDESWFDSQWRHPEGRYCYELTSSLETPMPESLPPVPAD